jgi:hypothetical protein
VLLGGELLQARVLGHEIPQPLGLVSLQTAVLRPPPVDLDSVTSSWRSTAARSLPSLRFHPPSQIFLTAYSGVSLRQVMIASILSAHERDMTNTHSDWIASPGTQSAERGGLTGPGQRLFACGQKPWRYRPARGLAPRAVRNTSCPSNERRAKLDVGRQLELCARSVKKLYERRGYSR